MRIARRFPETLPARIALICLSLIWGYAVLRSGGVSAQDWEGCELALGIVGMSFALFLRPDADMPRLEPSWRWPLLLLPCYVAIQAIPLPLGLVRVISPTRAALVNAIAPVMGAAALAPLSVQADSTWEFLLRLLVYILVFALIRRIAGRFSANPWVVVFPVLAVAVLEAVLGIAQYAADPAHNVAQGTYLNRNHLAGLLEMAFPFAIMFSVSVGIRSGLTWMSEMRTAAKVGLGFAAAVSILLGIILSLSRTAFVAALVSILVMSVLILRHDLRGRPRRIALLSGAGLLITSLLLTFVVFPPGRLMARFGALAQYGGSDSGTDRGVIWAQTMRLIADYPAVGCGLGAYSYTWLKYKTDLVLWATDFAHNDYLQLLAELGVVGFGILAVLLIAILIRLTRATAPAVPAESRHLAIACMGAFTAILLHSLDDFNLYVPANALLLAWIAGIAAALPVRRAGLRRSKPDKLRVSASLALIICGVCIPTPAAETLLGSLAGTGSLLLNGSDVATAGVLSWPVVSGDEIATATAPAVILLRDSNRVFLEPRTQLRIEQRGGRLTINLLAGQLYFSLEPKFAVELQASGEPVLSAGLIQGALSIEKKRPLLKAGVPPPPLILNAESLMRRFPYWWGFSANN